MNNTMDDPTNPMTDPDPERDHETDSEADADDLRSVDALGGDADIMESLPDEGSPIHRESTYDEMAEALDPDESNDDRAGEEPAAPADDAADIESTSVESSVADEAAWDPTADVETASWDAPLGDAAPWNPEASYNDFLDIDMALASVSTLGELIPQRESEEQAELEAARKAQAERIAAVERPLRALQAPKPMLLRRGQMASVVPALALMAVGAWLTFAVTAPGAVPMSPALLLVIVGAVLVVTLFSQWLASGRWSRGVFFVTALALLGGGAVYYSTTTDAGTRLIAPLMFVAAGIAFALTGILARPADRRLLLPGALLVVAGIAAAVVLTGVVPFELTALATPLWPVLLAMMVVLWLLPVVLKRRT